MEPQRNLISLPSTHTRAPCTGFELSSTIETQGKQSRTQEQAERRDAELCIFPAQSCRTRRGFRRRRWPGC